MASCEENQFVYYTSSSTGGPIATISGTTATNIAVNSNSCGTIIIMDLSKITFKYLNFTKDSYINFAKYFYFSDGKWNRYGSGFPDLPNKLDITSLPHYNTVPIPDLLVIMATASKGTAIGILGSDT